MRKLFQNRRYLALTIFGVIFLALLVAPTTTHACYLWCLDDVLDAILSLVTVVKSLLGTLLDFAGKALKWSLDMSMKAILELQVIDAAWRVVRDLANFVFIIMLVVISFSTILSVIPSLQKYHYTKALKGVIIAALLMNFSLAIGKTVVLASDQVARMIINIMPDLGDDLVKTLKPQVAILNPNGLAGPSPYDPGADVTKTLTAVEDKRYKECLKEEVAITERARVWRFLVNAPRSGPGSTPITTKGIGECAAEVQAARRAGSAVTAGLQPDAADAAAAERQRASAAANTTQEKIFLIWSGLLSSLLILILTLCLITPCIFIFLRMLMLWILLFSSPIAWAGYAVPESGVFEKWWKLFIGWNLFAPVYLFAIIPGMIVLQGSGELLTGLGTDGVDIGTASGLFQIFMFHAFAVLIFLGGLWVAMQTSFASAVKTTPIVGGWAGKIGALDAGGGAKLAGRFTKTVGKYTGANAYLEAAKLRAQQAGTERLNRGQLGRIFQAVKPASAEERLARAKARLGVTGGAAALDAVKAAQVKAQSENLEQQTAGMSTPKKEAFLRARMDSPNLAVKLAAREQLIAMGKLRDAEIEKTRRMYTSVPARQAFDTRVRRAAGAAIAAKKKEEKEARDDLISQIGSKSYASAADVTTELGRLSNPDDRRAAEEAIGKKSPLLLLEHLRADAIAKGKPLPPGDFYRQAFSAVLKDKDSLVRLGQDYFKPGPEFDALKEAIAQRYPTPGAPQRDKYRDSLISANPSLQTEIELLIPG